MENVQKAYEREERMYNVSEATTHIDTWRQNKKILNTQGMEYLR